MILTCLLTNHLTAECKKLAQKEYKKDMATVQEG